MSAVIDVGKILTIFGILGVLIFAASVFKSASEGDADEVINKSIEKMEDETVSKIHWSILLLILKPLVALIVFILGLLGIAVKVKW